MFLFKMKKLYIESFTKICDISFNKYNLFCFIKIKNKCFFISRPKV